MLRDRESVTVLNPKRTFFVRLAGTRSLPWGVFSFSFSFFVLALVHASELKAHGELEFTTQPRSQTVPAGTNVTFTAEASGTNVHYQWSRNGLPLSGATSSTLTLSNVSPAVGGTYSVTASSGSQAKLSHDAVLLVTAPLLPFDDKFSKSGVLPTNLSGIGLSDNRSTGSEGHEPNHAGIWAQNTIWIRWVPPVSGIAQLNTLGSSFDTVLAVYTGSDLRQLALVAADDESGGFHSSRVLFNAVAGVEYQVVVGAYEKKGEGNVVLSWSLLPSLCPLPEAITVPPGRAVLPEAPVDFCVSWRYTNECALGLQWTLDGDPVAGATDLCLHLPAAGVTDVGLYALQVSSSNWTFNTPPIELQINTEGSDALARKRLEDARNSALVGTIDPGAGFAKSLPKAGAPLASGYSGSQVFKTYPGKDPSEPSACGVLGGASYWFSYVPPADGILTLTTDGSTYDTVLGVYVDNGQNLGYASLVELACDNDGGTNGRTSSLSLPVTRGTNYFIMVDGVNGAAGRVSLNYRLNTPPTVSSVPPQSLVENGATAWLPFTVSDRESAATQLLVSAVCGDASLVDASGFAFSGSGTNRQMRVTPVADSFGTNLVWLLVTDLGSCTRTSSFALAVIRAPRPLQVSPVLPLGTIGCPYAKKAGVAGGTKPYTFSIIAAPGAGWTITSDGLLKGRPDGATNTFTLRVTDGAGSATNQVVTLISLPPVRLQPKLNGRDLGIRLKGKTNVTYVLEMTLSLETPNWVPVSTNISAVGEIEFPPVLPSTSTVFFRTREE